MAIARYKDLCIDSSDNETLGRFWAAALGLRFEPDDAAGTLLGEVDEQRVWMNVVPEQKTAKHRVHIDIHAASVEEIVALGAVVLEPAEEFDRPWTVLADPEGGEFCVFVRSPDRLPAYRLYEIVVDCADPQQIARWWADVLGARLGSDPAKGWAWFEEAPAGLPFDGMSFVPVPEPKTVKNRVHWDVTADSIDDLVAVGARLLRTPTAADDWHVLADPEGNEFCAFTGG
ncbi:MAG: VOC family protein [Nocardioidaceae bacterium]|nr:VOC family protein [Nocardioidaceae bacterium]